MGAVSFLSCHLSQAGTSGRVTECPLNDEKRLYGRKATKEGAPPAAGAGTSEILPTVLKAISRYPLSHEISTKSLRFECASPRLLAAFPPTFFSERHMQFEGPLLDLYLHYCSVGLGSPSSAVRAACVGMLGPLLLRASESTGEFLSTMLRMAEEVQYV